MKLPIRNQILWPLVCLLLVAILANALFAAWWASRQTLRSMEARQNQIVGVIEQADFPLAPSVMEQLHRLTGDDFVVWDIAAQQIIAGTLPQQNTVVQDLAHVLTELKGNQPQFGSVNSETYLIRQGQLRLKPHLKLLVLTPSNLMRETSSSAMWPPLAVGTATILILIPLAMMLASFWARRIHSVERHVERIAHGEFGVELVPGPIGDELSRLVVSINSMSRQLSALRQELIRAERTKLVAQLTAGFAHQLRNGLAGARLAVELHQSRCPLAEESSLGVARQQLMLVEEETRGLLTLGRSEFKQSGPVDLAELALTVGKLIQPICVHRNVELKIDCPSDIGSISGQADAIRAAVLNTTLNAMEAAGPGGHISLLLDKSDERVVIAIEDDGPGPPSETATSMFEPFVTSKPSGIGLGLAVAQSVVQDHQGTMNWRHVDGLTRFEISLPIAAKGNSAP